MKETPREGDERVWIVAVGPKDDYYKVSNKEAGVGLLGMFRIRGSTQFEEGYRAGTFYPDKVPDRVRHYIEYRSVKTIPEKDGPPMKSDVFRRRVRALQID